MTEQVTIDVAGSNHLINLDHEKNTWTPETDLVEGEFPLITSTEGKRYELYSDGTFAEVEL